MFAKITIVCLISAGVSFTFYHCNAISDNVQNFQSFTNELIVFSNQSEEATDIKPGVKLFNAFGVGYLLAAINGKMWNFPTSGIHQALRTPEDSIANDYSEILLQLNQKDFSTSSMIYTRFGNVTDDPNCQLEKLNTQIREIDFVNEPEKFWSIISDQIQFGTKEQLKDELLPEVMWQKVFENSTQGAFVNTVHHKSYWDVPWQDIGHKSFNYDTIVKFYETEGSYSIYETKDLSAVQIPLKNNTKKLVFIKPYAFMDLTKIRSHINNISFKSQDSWVVKTLKIQIPALNVTNLSRNYQGLVKMGISEAFCRSNESDPDEYKFELQPIAQANHFEFSGDYIEIASATGAIINYKKYIPKEILDVEEQDEIDEYEVDDESHVENENSDYEGLPLPLPLPLPIPLQFRKSRKTMKIKLREDKNFGTQGEGKCEKPEEFGNSHQKSQSAVHFTDGKPTLIFDTPFFYFLKDNELGEIFSGAINSLCQYKRVSAMTKSSATHTWLHDVFKVAFWKCV